MVTRLPWAALWLLTLAAAGIAAGFNQPGPTVVLIVLLLVSAGLWVGHVIVSRIEDLTDLERHPNG